MKGSVGSCCFSGCKSFTAEYISEEEKGIRRRKRRRRGAGAGDIARLPAGSQISQREISKLRKGGRFTGCELSTS